jgi:pantetheine-phosphate adenylyltransferase
MAQMNYHLAGFETFFVATNPAYGYLSSSLVKEVATLGGSVDRLVPPQVLAALEEKLR